MSKSKKAEKKTARKLAREALVSTSQTELEGSGKVATEPRVEEKVTESRSKRNLVIGPEISATLVSEEKVTPHLEERLYSSKVFSASDSMVLAHNAIRTLGNGMCFVNAILGACGVFATNQVLEELAKRVYKEIRNNGELLQKDILPIGSRERWICQEGNELVYQELSCAEVFANYFEVAVDVFITGTSNIPGVAQEHFGSWVTYGENFAREHIGNRVKIAFDTNSQHCTTLMPRHGAQAGRGVFFSDKMCKRLLVANHPEQCKRLVKWALNQSGISNRSLDVLPINAEELEREEEYSFKMLGNLLDWQIQTGKMQQQLVEILSKSRDPSEVLWPQEIGSKYEPKLEHFIKEGREWHSKEIDWAASIHGYRNAPTGKRPRDWIAMDRAAGLPEMEKPIWEIMQQFGGIPYEAAKLIYRRASSEVDDTRTSANVVDNTVAKELGSNGSYDVERKRTANAAQGASGSTVGTEAGPHLQAQLTAQSGKVQDAQMVAQSRHIQTAVHTLSLSGAMGLRGGGNSSAEGLEPKSPTVVQDGSGSEGEAVVPTATGKGHDLVRGRASKNKHQAKEQSTGKTKEGDSSDPSSSDSDSTVSSESSSKSALSSSTSDRSGSESDDGDSSKKSSKSGSKKNKRRAKSKATTVYVSLELPPRLPDSYTFDSVRKWTEAYELYVNKGGVTHPLDVLTKTQFLYFKQQWTLKLAKRYGRWASARVEYTLNKWLQLFVKLARKIWHRPAELVQDHQLNLKFPSNDEKKLPLYVEQIARAKELLSQTSLSQKEKITALLKPYYKWNDVFHADFVALYKAKRKRTFDEVCQLLQEQMVSWSQIYKYQVELNKAVATAAKNPQSGGQKRKDTDQDNGNKKKKFKKGRKDRSSSQTKDKSKNEEAEAVNATTLVSRLKQRQPEMADDKIQECLDKDLCLKCKKPGHKMKDCKVKKVTINAITPTGVVALLHIDSNTLVEVIAALDSGAQAESFISSSLANRLVRAQGYKIKREQELLIAVANGATELLTHRLMEVQLTLMLEPLGLENKKIMFSPYILKECSVGVIIGTDALVENRLEEATIRQMQASYKSRHESTSSTDDDSDLPDLIYDSDSESDDTDSDIPSLTSGSDSDSDDEQPDVVLNKLSIEQQQNVQRNAQSAKEKGSSEWWTQCPELAQLKQDFPTVFVDKLPPEPAKLKPFKIELIPGAILPKTQKVRHQGQRMQHPTSKCKLSQFS